MVEKAVPFWEIYVNILLFFIRNYSYCFKLSYLHFIALRSTTLNVVQDLIVMDLDDTIPGFVALGRLL
ncbi:hypothetical protein ASZ90_014202 [hydrocarbon metagenome]|uniref:Uncharacterized protein n=1 Tax=hydrocarbon metagenome TaxID=938273 RepID=A0A0W8F6V1_9ZZZZ